MEKVYTRKKFSLGSINRALMRILAKESENEFEKFLIQQNLVQYLLMIEIISRNKLLDKNFLNWIENQTLGHLIQCFKICAVQNKKEGLFIRRLEQYNKKRNYLVHKIIKDSDYSKVKNEVKIVNEAGLVIIKYLENLNIPEL